MMCEGRDCQFKAVYTLKWSDKGNKHHELNVCQKCCQHLAGFLEWNSLVYSITTIGKTEFIFR